MNRRGFLAAVAGTTALAGCQRAGRGTATPSDPSESPTRTTVSATATPTESDTPTASDTPTETEHPTETDRPTETERCLGQTDRRLPIGASVEHNDWTFTVSEFELTQTYQFEGESKTRTLPEDKQFVIVTVDAVNRADERRLWTFDSGFRLIAEGCLTIRWDTDFPTEESPEIGEPFSEIDRIDHLKQFLQQVYYPFDPGQSGRMWYPAYTDASYERSELEVGSDFHGDATPVRWVPTLETTTET